MTDVPGDATLQAMKAPWLPLDGGAAPHCVSSPSVSNLYADSLGAFLGERGIGLDDLRAPRPRDTHPGHRVCGSSYAQTLANGARELGDNALGLRFGTRVGASGFGMLGIAAATAPSLRDAIRHLTQIESITSTLGRATAIRHGQRVSVMWRPAQAVAPAVIEGILTGWVSFGRYLLGEHVDVTQVEFMHRRIAPMHAYEGSLECPVRFGARCYAVVIKAELLDARPRFADDALNASMSAWLGHCAAAAATNSNTLTRRIVALLGPRLAVADVDEQAVAAMLGVECRSLQRRLCLEGTTFRQILNASRAQHAIIALLGSDATMLELSGNIGFDEQSSLCRAFRKWTGHTPLAFKQRMSGLFQALRMTPDARPASAAHCDMPCANFMESL